MVTKLRFAGLLATGLALIAGIPFTLVLLLATMLFAFRPRKAWVPCEVVETAGD